MPLPSSPSSPPARNVFREIALIRDPDDVVTVLTERELDGRISFTFFREFERPGEGGLSEPSRSIYFSRHHIPAIRRLLQELDRRFEAIEEQSRAARRSAAQVP